MSLIFINSSLTGEESNYRSMSSIDTVVNNVNLNQVIKDRVDDAVISDQSENISVQKESTKEFSKLVKIINYPIRKGAHLFEYLILAVLFVIALSNYRIRYRKLIYIAFFVCFLYACSDEIHQLFVIGRTARVFDVFIDTLGIVVGLFASRMFYRVKTVSILPS